ncbi:MAG: tetratricopeptide repeat protein [Smithellaceae bacterium]|nr:tetratricopeptide repeat protein [Smithellaceae bacterium]
MLYGSPIRGRILAATAAAIILVLSGSGGASLDVPSFQDWEQEVARCQGLLKTDPGNARYLNTLGFAYYRLRRLPEAIVAYRQAIARDDRYSVAYNNLGVVYLETAAYGKGEEAFRHALRCDPGNAKAAYNLAVSLYRQQRYHEAYRAYLLAKSIDNSYVKVRLQSTKLKEEVNRLSSTSPDDKLTRRVEQEIASP